MASRSWNRVELIGNLTRDPELRFTPNGAAVCTFGLATNRTFVTDGEKREEVDFHRLVSWNKLAELCNQLLKKGTKVFISGRLQTRSWAGQDGQQRQTTEIVVEDMILLSPKVSTEGAAPALPEELHTDERPTTFKVKTEEPVVEAVEDKKEKDAPKESHPKDGQPLADKEAESTPPQEEVKDDLPF